MSEVFEHDALEVVERAEANMQMDDDFAGEHLHVYNTYHSSNCSSSSIRKNDRCTFSQSSSQALATAVFL
jgi:hypothetical protein